MLKNDLNKLKASVETYILENLSKDISGHNGPYRDKETPIRYKAHMICFLCNTDPEIRYKEQVKLLVAQILSSDYNLQNGFFINRFKEGKDQVNGVIGIAWIIEAFSLATIKYNFDETKDYLHQVEEKIPFIQTRALWQGPVNNHPTGWKTDNNFNHQLWLAYSLILKSKALNIDVSTNVKLFFSKINHNLNVRKSGLIAHSIRNESKFKGILKDVRDRIKGLLLGKTKNYKENGYHLFNLFAFARIKQEGFSYLFENNLLFQKALRYCNNELLHNSLNNNHEETDFYYLSPPSNLRYNRYGIHYNVSGLEYLVIKSIFNLEDCKGGNDLIKNQISCYDLNIIENSMSEDIVNFILRTYELTYLNKC